MNQINPKHFLTAIGLAAAALLVASWALATLGGVS